MKAKVIEQAASLHLSFQARLSQSDLSRHYERVLRQKSQQTKLFGFRHNRAPLALIEGTHRSELIEAAWRSALEESLYFTVKSLNKLPFSAPQIASKVEQAPKTQDYRFAAQVEVFPEIKLKRIRGYRLELPRARLEASDLESALFQLRLQHATNHRIPGRKAELNDRLVLQYALLDDGGEVQREGKRWFNLDPQRLWSFKSEEAEGGDPLKELDPSIFLGRQEEEVLMTELPQPQGPALRCRIKLEQILVPKLPEVTRHWIRSLGVRPHTLTQLKTTLHQQLETRVELFRTNQLKFTLLQLLEATHPELAVPPSLLLSILRHELQAQPKEGSDAQDLNSYTAEALEAAARIARPHLFLGYIIAHYSIQTSPEEVAKLERKISHSGLEDLPQEPETFEAKVRQYLLEKKAVDIIKEGLELEEPQLSFEDFLAYAQGKGATSRLDPPDGSSMVEEAMASSTETLTEEAPAKKKVATVKTPASRRPKSDSSAASKGKAGLGKTSAESPPKRTTAARPKAPSEPNSRPKRTRASKVMQAEPV